jgi:hypothetical protein
MATTFAEHLKQLALSMDHIDEPLFDHITELIEHFLFKSLNIQNAKIMISDRVDGKMGLMRHSLKGFNNEIAIPIKKDDGSLYGQSALAFEKKQPLWIVSATGKQRLESCEGYTDLWNGLKKLPKYRQVGETEQPVKTRILVPIKVRRSNRIFGVLLLETADYLNITEAAKNELKKIADVISIVIRSYKISVASEKRTVEAIKSLGNNLKGPLPTLTKPSLFLAFSQKAEKDVTRFIVKTLKDKFSDKVHLISWEEMDHPGNINQQLVDAISDCRYAICYMSEKNEVGEFRDNPNVIFEAGMFHGRTEATHAVPSKWIPVREKDSPKPPFDFAQERILLVERNKDSSLKEKVFANKFREMVDAMLNLS